MNALVSGPVLPLLVVSWPLLLALVPILPRWGAHARMLLPLAPVPALALALGGAQEITEAPGLLLGVTLGASPAGALLLGMTAAVWTVAGWHAAHSMTPGPQMRLLCAFWFLTLAGNLGVFLAADVVSFYVAFAAVSLAAWFLVVHKRTKAAFHAGWVYIILAVLGETALLLGLLIAAQGAGSLLLADLRAALPGIEGGNVALGLMLAGLGIKAGMVPLHVWLPLAHPAAPVPGSAVLSGAIVKAGLIGVLAIVPDTGHDWAGQGLVVLGIAGAFGAAVFGLTQVNPKAVLAYSTVSQMGVMLALAGAGQGAVAYYAAHHGLAKAGLFLLVGAIGATASGAWRWAALALGGVLAASVAGLPLTGGALVKAAAKPGLTVWLAQAVALSAITTTALLGWFLWRVGRSVAAARQAAASPMPLLAGVGVLAAGAFVLPWLQWANWTELPRDYPLRGASLWAGFWPVVAGGAVLAVLVHRPLPERPPGDLLIPLAAMLRTGSATPAAVPPAQRSAQGRAVLLHLLRRTLARMRRAERRLTRWPLAGALMVAAVLGGWALMI